MPLSILEETVAVMKLVPHERVHQRTVTRKARLTQKTVELSSRSPSGDEKKQWRCLGLGSTTTSWIPVVQKRTDNGEQMPQMQFQRVKQKIEIAQLQLVQETIRSEIGRMTLEKTFEERDALRCRRKPNTA